ncbi:MAG: flagellar M-ring protein FliF [bacterium]|nr:flagellar M-ring protein FliF [bacterium]
MPAFLEAIRKFADSFRSLPLNRKIALSLVLVILVGGVVALMSWANRANYQPLYSRLDPEDAGAILTRLKESKIPYRLKNGGTTILVPEDKVYELRLQMATDRVFQKGIVGFELFDQTNLGTTEFVQTVNYHRALEGELSRTIGSLAEVEWARVHLAIPQKSLFIEKEQPPTASVVIRLREGSSLRKAQINGIVHLVSCSVEGLIPENVKVIDHQGRILSENPNDFSSQLIQANKVEYQMQVEEILEKKVTAMLEKALGEGKVIAKVSVSLNLKQVETTEEKYDPDRTVVKTEQRTQEAAQGQTPVTPAAGNNSNYQKSDEIIKYELTKATNHIIELPGQINRLSVAVLVDGRYEKQDKGVKYIPRTPEEIKSIRTIAEKAVGYDPSRGDQIEVVNIPFSLDSAQGHGQASLDILKNWPLWLSLAKYGSKLLLILIILLFIFRPLVKWLYHFTPQPLPENITPPLPPEDEARKIEEALTDEQAMISELQQKLPSRLSQVEQAFQMANNEESRALEDMVKVIREIAKQEPKRISQLTHEWLLEERKQS